MLPAPSPAALSLRSALVRGVIVTAVNWPVVLLEFAIEAVYKAAILVPVLGGAVMVAAVLGADIRSLVADGLRETVGLVLDSLQTAPAALVGFVSATGLVAAGGCLLMFLVKTGTLAVLVEGERQCDARRPGRTALPASSYSPGALVAGARRFGRRTAALAAGLVAAYATGIAIYLGTLSLGSRWAAALAAAWPLLVLVAAGMTLVAITLVHLTHDLLRLIVITDDCSVREAVQRLRAFLLLDARQVVGIFVVMTTVELLLGALALLATGALTLLAWLPLASMLVVPLQLAAWLLRGVAFQALSLTAIVAYQAQYRRSAVSTGGAAVQPPDGANAASE